VSAAASAAAAVMAVSVFVMSPPKSDGATVALRLTEKSDLQAPNTQVELPA
jgi:hypothetical protein